MDTTAINTMNATTPTTIPTISPTDAPPGELFIGVDESGVTGPTYRFYSHNQLLTTGQLERSKSP